MKRKKNMLLSSGIVGLSAVALAVSPAMAESITTKASHKEVVEKVEEAGTNVLLNQEQLLELGLEGNFKIVLSSEKSSASDNGGDETAQNLKTVSKENVKVETVFDDADKAKGQKTTVTVEKEGVWVFLTDTEGNLLSLDFKPAEGFTGDPTISYSIVENTESDVESENVVELNDRETVQTEKVDAKNADTVVNLDELDESAVTGNILLDYPDEEKVEEVDESEVVAEKTESKEKKEETVESTESKTVEKVEVTSGNGVARTLMAPAAPAPAAPIDDEDPEEFETPNLTVDNASKGGPVTVSFGTDGGNLPSNVDKGSLSFIADGDEQIVLNNGKDLQQPSIGEWSVDGENGFVFEAYGSFQGDSAKAIYTVMNNEGGVAQGTITVNFAQAEAGNGNDSDGGEEPDAGVDQDETDDPSVVGGPDAPASDDDPTNDNGTDRVDENGNPVVGDDSTTNTGTGAESDINGPGTVDTGAEMFQNNSILYAAAAGIAGIFGAAMLFLSRTPSALKNNKK